VCTDEELVELRLGLVYDSISFKEMLNWIINYIDKKLGII